VTHDSTIRDILKGINGFSKWGVMLKPPTPSSSKLDSFDLKIGSPLNLVATLFFET